MCIRDRIITSSDIRRAFIKGYNKDSSIKKIVNYKPLFLKDKVDENQLSRVHGPVGLFLGGSSPAEIAIAIIAQITQARYKTDK